MIFWASWIYELNVLRIIGHILIYLFSNNFISLFLFLSYSHKYLIISMVSWYSGHFSNILLLSNRFYLPVGVSVYSDFFFYLFCLKCYVFQSSIYFYFRLVFLFHVFTVLSVWVFFASSVFLIVGPEVMPHCLGTTVCMFIHESWVLPSTESCYYNWYSELTKDVATQLLWVNGKEIIVALYIEFVLFCRKS